MSTSDTTLLVNSSIIQEAKLSDLWRLDVLGIEDPLQRQTKQEKEEAVDQRFNETTVINDQGRYEVMLPWIPDHAPLSTNKSIAIRRLENTVSNLKQRGLLAEYDKVLNDWERGERTVL